MEQISNRYIITGGPGSGKSTLLEALAREGYQCFEEISRVVIREQHAMGGDIVPWGNLKAFAEICYQRMCSQLDACPEGNVCFYDRGLPDIIAYVRRGGLPVPEKFFEKCNDYCSTVFIAPPWEEIFVNDSERPESFKDSKEIYRFLKEAYEELNFQVIELPKATIRERIKFIEKHLASPAEKR